MNYVQPTVAGILGLGLPELMVIVALLAVLAAPVVLVVWLIMRGTGKSQASPVSSSAHKKCPDCAEFVLSEARVCKHCGYKFEAEMAGRV